MPTKNAFKSFTKNSHSKKGQKARERRSSSSETKPEQVFDTRYQPSESLF